MNWYKALGTNRRSTRFNDWGFINDPDCWTPGSSECSQKGYYNSACSRPSHAVLPSQWIKNEAETQKCTRSVCYHSGFEEMRKEKLAYLTFLYTRKNLIETTPTVNSRHDRERKWQAKNLVHRPRRRQRHHRTSGPPPQESCVRPAWSRLRYSLSYRMFLTENINWGYFKWSGLHVHVLYHWR